MAEAPFFVYTNILHQYLEYFEPMTNPKKEDPNLIKLSPPTLFAIAVAVVLIPLLLVGFISQ